jgi:hypothetical protein
MTRRKAASTIVGIPNGTRDNPGTMARVALWCMNHRGRVLIGWVALLIAVLGASSAVGTRNANQFSLPGTESRSSD